MVGLLKIMMMETLNLAVAVIIVLVMRLEILYMAIALDDHDVKGI